MPLSAFSRHHFDQGQAAVQEDRLEEAGEHVRQILQDGTREDVLNVFEQLRDSLNRK